MLRTNDLKGSIEFYTKILGFTCDGSSDDWGWASVKRDNVCIMFALPNAHEPFARPGLHRLALHPCVGRGRALGRA